MKELLKRSESDREKEMAGRERLEDVLTAAAFTLKQVSCIQCCDALNSECLCCTWQAHRSQAQEYQENLMFVDRLASV